MAAKKLKPGLLDSVQAALLALVSKQRLLLAAVLPPLLVLVPPAVLERTELAALQALARTQPLLVQVQRAVVHLK